MTVQAWAYNGTVPGPVIRVDEGDLVQVRLHNQLTVGTTIHWHDLALPNGQDGVAGVTQDPVPPGGSATYSFVAKDAIVKDTVVVRPGSSVTIGVLADNPGWWMIHCHQLHHAAGGMMVLLRYVGSPRLAQIGGPFQSAPD